MYCQPIQYPMTGQTTFDRVFYQDEEIGFGSLPYNFSVSETRLRPLEANGVWFRRISAADG